MLRQLTQKDLSHIVFLSNVVLEGNKKGLMEETLRSLLFIIKSLPDIEVPEDVAEEINRLTDNIEQKLRWENERIQEIRSNLAPKQYRNPSE